MGPLTYFLLPHSSPVSGFYHLYYKINTPLKYNYQNYQKRLILVPCSVNTFLAGPGSIHDIIIISITPFPSNLKI